MSRNILANDKIRSQQVRLIDDEGAAIGIIPTRSALYRAREAGLDLVQISDGSGGVPVCKITELGKYVYDMKKNQKEQDRRRRELTVDIREVQLRPNTDDADMVVKSKKANEFLSQGDKVKVIVKFRGRERSHKDIGKAVIDKFIGMVEGGIPDTVTDAGRDLIVFILPERTKSEIIKARSAK